MMLIRDACPEKYIDRNLKMPKKQKILPGSGISLECRHQKLNYCSDFLKRMLLECSENAGPVDALRILGCP